MQVALFILAFILFVGLVLAHEWGHFIIAKRNGVVPEEFGLGFPPQAWSKKLKSGLILSLNWLPIGGFVKLRGEHDSDKRPGSFGAASLRAKAKILMAGVAANAVVGVVLLTILAAVGMPVLITKDFNSVDQFTVKSDTKVTRQQVEIGQILSGSPAAKAGLSSTDTVVSLANNQRKVAIYTVNQLHDATASFAGQTVRLAYRHDGQTLTKNIHLLNAAEVNASQSSDNPKGYLGVAPNQLTIQRSTWSSPIVALGLSGQFVWLTLQGIGHAFGGLGSWIAGIFSGNHAAQTNGAAQAENQVGGPVAIMEILWHSGDLGLNFTLAFIAVISLTLALINILPLPALDGGRLLLSIISRRLMRRPMSQAAEERIVGTGMALLFLLIILITIVDVKRSF